MEITARVTANAQVKELPSGSKVINFSVAINDRYRNKEGEVKEITTFVDCSYWKQSGLAPFLTKGTLVEMQGRIGTRAWLTMNGEAKASLTFHVNTVKLHGSSKNKTVTEPVAAVKKAEVVTAEAGDDLPF